MASKKAEQTATPKPLTAKDILARKKVAADRWLPSDETLAELTALMEARDAGAAITMVDAIELLNSHGWVCGQNKFADLMRRHYGRTWGGR